MAGAPADSKTYNVWFRQDPAGGNAEKYLVDDSGRPVYYVDPGINGTIRKLPNGQDVPKFDAPKATLMSYIIKGILGGELPWGLVLLGVMIAVVLELSGIPSLAFAVGVYLPLSSSSPILIGGMVRWAVDKWIAKKHAGKQLTEEQLVAEGDKSPGVLMASGYIAGGAIAGILIAFLAGVPFMAGFNQQIGSWAEGNPLLREGVGDLVSLIPFLILIALLYLTGREKILIHRETT
ncbi:MAG: OPT/YSL family transporter [Thermoanaerobaculia bacterium]